MEYIRDGVVWRRFAENPRMALVADQNLASFRTLLPVNRAIVKGSRHPLASHREKRTRLSGGFALSPESPDIRKEMIVAQVSGKLNKDL